MHAHIESTQLALDCTLLWEQEAILQMYWASMWVAKRSEHSLALFDTLSGCVTRLVGPSSESYVQTLQPLPCLWSHFLPHQLPPDSSLNPFPLTKWNTQFPPGKATPLTSIPLNFLPPMISHLIVAHLSKRPIDLWQNSISVPQPTCACKWYVIDQGQKYRQSLHFD